MIIKKMHKIANKINSCSITFNINFHKVETLKRVNRQRNKLYILLQTCMHTGSLYFPKFCKSLSLKRVCADTKWKLTSIIGLVYNVVGAQRTTPKGSLDPGATVGTKDIKVGRIPSQNAVIDAASSHVATCHTLFPCLNFSRPWIVPALVIRLKLHTKRVHDVFMGVALGSIVWLLEHAVPQLDLWRDLLCRMAQLCSKGKFITIIHRFWRFILAESTRNEVHVRGRKCYDNNCVCSSILSNGFCR